jgi:gluconate 2-dehydrogenase gamma chain
MSDNNSVLAMNRRRLLVGTTVSLFGVSIARAATINGEMPWAPNAGNPPKPVTTGGWLFFTPEEGRAMEAIADRIIPPDSETPGGKDSGSAVFIDRQLAGPYGHQDGLYVRPPFMNGQKNQGAQSADGPAQKYRKALAALDKAVKSKYGGKSFADLAENDQDEVLKGLEKGDLKLEGADGQSFFTDAIRDVQMGFFADPLYGGNRDMVGWKMIGFPGARYNYLDWIDRHNERFPLPPVSITGRADWNVKS